MYLLDTNHCSRIIAGSKSIIEKAKAVGSADILTCVIVSGELTLMGERSEQHSQNMAQIRGFLSRISILPIDEQTAIAYGELKAALFKHYGPKDRQKARKTTITSLGFSDNDLWIASVALRHGMTLVSEDDGFSRMQPVKGLKVECWLDRTVDCV